MSAMTRDSDLMVGELLLALITEVRAAALPIHSMIVRFRRRLFCDPTPFVANGQGAQACLTKVKCDSRQVEVRREVQGLVTLLDMIPT